MWFEKYFVGAYREICSESVRKKNAQISSQLDASLVAGPEQMPGKKSYLGAV